MSPSPNSQVMFASALSWIGDFCIFGIHTFNTMATFLNIWICMLPAVGCRRWQNGVGQPMIQDRGRQVVHAMKDFAPLASPLLGVALRASRDTTQLLLGVSLRARSDTTLVLYWNGQLVWTPALALYLSGTGDCIQRDLSPTSGYTGISARRRYAIFFYF